MTESDLLPGLGSGVHRERLNPLTTLYRMFVNCFRFNSIDQRISMQNLLENTGSLEKALMAQTLAFYPVELYLRSGPGA